MNYAKIYNQIINRALDADRLKNTDIYFESHHIIPKSLGGTNDSNNLVLLTAREHFIAHKLRVKDKHPLYGKSRPEHSEWLKQNHPIKGKTHSEETKNKIRKSLEQTRLKKIGEQHG